MCRNHSHATVLTRGQAVLTTAGWLTVYQAVGEIKLEQPTGEVVIIPPSGIFFVPCPGWEGFAISDSPPMEELTTSAAFSMADVLALLITSPKPTTKP